MWGRVHGGRLCDRYCYLWLSPTGHMDSERYLSRLNIDPGTVTAEYETLERLQNAHVRSVPFENIAITGDPSGTFAGSGVSLDAASLFEKIVERQRGGFCYELNGLFGWLLEEFGFDRRQVAGRVLTGDGEARPPANHLTNIVTLDRRYIVDVGLGLPPARRPLPFDGESRRDETGVEWRLTESGRPDADYQTEFRRPDDEEWIARYVFRDQERQIEYVAATCEYLTTAPESPFTGEPFVTIATDSGHLKLKNGTLVRTENGETREVAVADDEWPAMLESEFGIPVQS